MIGKHNFQCVWMAEDQSCPKGAKPQGIGCSVLCSTLNMKFQAITIKCRLRSKKNIYLSYIERAPAELKLAGIDLKWQKLSLSRALVLFCAHYFQAPDAQTNGKRSS